MEAPLVHELLEMKSEIIRQMDITDKLTNQGKGNRKSYLEVQNAAIIKKRSLKATHKQLGFNINDDDKCSENIMGDGDAGQEVRVTCDDTEMTDDEANNHDDKLNNGNKNKLKKNEEGIIFSIYLLIQVIRMTKKSCITFVTY